MNPFRLLGDMSHVAAIVLLPYKLHISRSAAGVSLKTQVLYLLVFVTRYMHLFIRTYSVYNRAIELGTITPGAVVSCDISRKINYSVLKITNIVLTAITIHMMRYRPSLKASYDSSLDHFRIWIHGIIPSFVLAIIVTLWNRQSSMWWEFSENAMLHFCWVFSEVLEPIAIVPQLLVFRGCADARRLAWVYVSLLAACRPLYMLDWVYRAYTERWYRHHPLLYVAATIQSGMYVIFLVDRICRVSRHLRPDESGDLKEPTSAAGEGLLPDQEDAVQCGDASDTDAHGGGVSDGGSSVNANANAKATPASERRDGETVDKMEGALLGERGRGPG